MSTLVGYALGTKSGKLFINPSCDNWDVTTDVHSVTIFKELKDLFKIRREIERGIHLTYWNLDSDVEIPYPTFYRIFHDGTYKELWL